MQEFAGSRAPVRGTQSFVGVMVAVWKRPSLTGLEVLWRWSAGLMLWLIAGAATHFQIPAVTDRMALLGGLSVFQPAVAVQTLATVVSGFFTDIMPLLRWFAPLATVLWLVVAAVGRTLVLRRYDPGMKARWLTVGAFGALRALLLAAVWGLWGWSVVRLVRLVILVPAARNEGPNLVLFSSLVICGTLLLYVLWGAASWFLQLAPLLAMECDLGVVASLRRALCSGKVLRSKLIETNLVMNIVKIALLVLALVFSASPLPFSSVETQAFLTSWWCGVAVWWLAMSDYFQVVRAAAYLSLWQTTEFVPESLSQQPESAS